MCMLLLDAMVMQLSDGRELRVTIIPTAGGIRQATVNVFDACSLVLKDRSKVIAVLLVKLLHFLLLASKELYFLLAFLNLL